MKIEISEHNARHLLMLLETMVMYPDVVDELRGTLTEIDTAHTTPPGESVVDRVNAVVAALHLTPGVPVLVVSAGRGGRPRQGFFVSVEMPGSYCDGQVLYAKVQWARKDGTPGPTTSQVDIRSLRVGPVRPNESEAER